jgi:hypothetical protein
MKQKPNKQKRAGYLNFQKEICPQSVPEFKFPNGNRGVEVCFKD